MYLDAQRRGVARQSGECESRGTVDLRGVHGFGIVCGEEHLSQPGRYSTSERVGGRRDLPFFCSRRSNVPPLLLDPRPSLRRPRDMALTSSYTLDSKWTRLRRILA